MVFKMLDPLTEFWLASDGARLTTLGAFSWLLAGLAAIMERRRSKSRGLDRLERVGWMPWTSIFLMFAFFGGGLLAMGMPALLGGA